MLLDYLTFIVTLGFLLFFNHVRKDTGNETNAKRNANKPKRRFFSNPNDAPRIQQRGAHERAGMDTNHPSLSRSGRHAEAKRREVAKWKGSQPQHTQNCGALRTAQSNRRCCRYLPAH